jgi:hypothetical protein
MQLGVIGIALLMVLWGVSGANASDFTVNPVGTCGPMLSANSSCTIAITFTPTADGVPESASIAVAIGSDPNSPHNITLTGTGPS